MAGGMVGEVPGRETGEGLGEEGGVGQSVDRDGGGSIGWWIVADRCMRV